MKKWTCLLAVVCSLAVCGQAESGETLSIRMLMDEAHQHLARRDVVQHDQTLRRAWQSEGDARDRVEAGVALARSLGHIHRDYAGAEKMLAEAQDLGARPALPLIERSALEALECNYDAACGAARSALSVSANARERRAARTRFAQAVYEEIIRTTLRYPQAATHAEAGDRIREATELLEPIIANEPGWPEPSRCQIMLALLVGNGPAALDARDSYFLLLPGEAAGEAHMDPPRDFGSLVFEDGQWTNRPLHFTEPGAVLAGVLPSFTRESDDPVRQRVVRALAGSRLYPEAAVLALHWNLTRDPMIREIIDYGRWTDRLSRRLAEAHRQHALGNDYRSRLRIPFLVDKPIGRTSLKKIMDSEAKTLWGKRRPNTAYREDQFWLDVRIAFGAVMYGQRVPTVFTYGHSVLELDQTVEQYGRRKVMKWMVVDSRVCSGYGEWLWSTAADRYGHGVGGWANPPAEFVQLRNCNSLYRWEALTEPELQQRMEESVERWTAHDHERAKAEPYGFSRGLLLRMAMRGDRRLLDRLKARGLGGAELRTAFLKEREHLENTCNIFGHEGRHALDLIEQPTGLTNDELEFRAKCSQVAFAPDPLLAGLGSIFSPNINPNGSGHSLANYRIMKGLVAWMGAHADEIQSLDRSLPLLPQFDLLTDDQMREAFRSLDPWAAGDA